MPVTHAAVRAALADVDYPASKDDLLAAARRNNADGDVERALRAVPNNPYQQELLGDEQGKRLPTIYSDAGDVRALAEFTEAERADARHGASAAQEAGLTAIHDVRGARGPRQGVGAWPRAGRTESTIRRGVERQPGRSTLVELLGRSRYGCVVAHSAGDREQRILLLEALGGLGA
jgi:Protein of unknown function (DUF2795)